MNRRQLFAALAALPIVGRLVPASAHQAPKPRPASLVAYRDLLLPALRGAHSEGRALHHPAIWESDIFVNFVEDNLQVKVITFHWPQRLAIGIISRENLSNRSYIAKFTPLLWRMREALLTLRAPLRRLGDDIIVVDDPITRITMDEVGGPQ
jgi:hypothetical protein